MNIKKISYPKGIAIAVVVFTVASMGIFAQETKKDEVTLADVVVALEKISTQLDADKKHETTSDNEKRNGMGMGGGPRFDFRYFLEMPKMNTYLATRGNYEPFQAYFLPFINSGAGTSRLVLNKNWQIGWNGWGGGVSSLGSRSVNAVDTIDQDADGQDDYYSYASYGINVNDFLVQFKVPVIANRFFFGAGALVGLGSESFSIEQNERSFVVTSVSSITGSSEWKRSLLDTGAYVTLQLQPNEKSRWFKLSLNGGFDYPIALGDWSPTAGVHKSISAPPADWVPMNFWAGIGMDFNL